MLFKAHPYNSHSLSLLLKVHALSQLAPPPYISLSQINHTNSQSKFPSLVALEKKAKKTKTHPLLQI
ncbi:hypothetical protein JHK85_010793 [Glycine max]|uniref:Uncharacterized protein n=1 Tax=Glycine soja TaxID=3848 RepID=A0A0B2QKA9_GLYSO|nr:hypothetical protein JHK87_010377 [Glycine soja]KAG5049690.1 hypothetical protein JHK85_010793 [Glycine max]KHN21851.1 hypothetical protein glysoja_032735 [Glycine soja]